MGRDSEGAGLWVLPCRGVGSGLDTLGPVGQRLVSGFLHMEQLQRMPSLPCPLPPCPDTFSPAVLGPAKEAGQGVRPPLLAVIRGSGAGGGLAYCRLILWPWRGPPSLSPSPLPTTLFHFPLSIRRPVNDTIKPRAP